MSAQSTPNKSPAIFFGIAALAVVISLGIMGYWLAAGSHFVTQYEVPVERTEVIEDEFGDEIETTRTVMEEDFRFGLMPDKGYDGAAPLAGGSLVLAIIFGGIGWRRRKKG